MTCKGFDPLTPKGALSHCPNECLTEQADCLRTDTIKPNPLFPDYCDFCLIRVFFAGCSPATKTFDYFQRGGEGDARPCALLRACTRAPLLLVYFWVGLCAALVILHISTKLVIFLVCAILFLNMLRFVTFWIKNKHIL